MDCARIVIGNSKVQPTFYPEHDVVEEKDRKRDAQAKKLGKGGLLKAAQKKDDKPV